MVVELESESQRLKFRGLLGILGARDFRAGRRQGKGAEQTLPTCISFLSQKLHMERPSIALVGETLDGVSEVQEQAGRWKV